MEINRDDGSNTSYALLSNYRSSLMGLAIMQLIVFHFTEDCKLFNEKFSGLISGLYNVFGSGGVDLFLLLSGLGLYYSFKVSNKHQDTFYARHLTKVLAPYFIVAMPAIFFRDLVIESRDFLYCIKDLTFFTFWGEGRVWYWFVLMIILCYIIFPFVYECIEYGKTDTEAILNALLLCILVTIISIILKLETLDFFSKTNILLLRFPAFIFGVLCGKLSYSNKTIGKGFLYIVLLLPLCLYLSHDGMVIVKRYTLALFVISCSIILLLIVNFVNNRINHKLSFPVLNWFGQYTYELYLTHITLRFFLNTYGLPTYRYKYELIMVASSVALSILLKKVTNKIYNAFLGQFLKKV